MINRRNFIKLTGLAGICAITTACEDSQLQWLFGQATTNDIQPLKWNNTPSERMAAHLLKRLSYGARPGDIAGVSNQLSSSDLIKATRNYIDQQLMPESIKDDQIYWLLRRIETLNLKTAELFDLTADEVIGDLRQATVLRALYSERQLLELMVEFWSDHFNIYADKGECAWLKVTDDREVIRKHALGKFSDLLRASAGSAAMLAYLDGKLNIAGKPNENYARELLELHTLGVDGGYQQQDVMECARALTGWRVRDRLWRGQVWLERSLHDNSNKTLLGRTIISDHSQSEKEIDQVIEIVSRHSATAHFISLKLARRFISDNPSTLLIDRVARRFQQSDGDIRETLRVLLHSDEFLTAPAKLKRPYSFAISAMRALSVKSDGGKAIQAQLQTIGQLPFNWPTPDGYPEGALHWQSQLLSRWNFALKLLAGEIKGSKIEVDQNIDVIKLASLLIQRELNSVEITALSELSDNKDKLAMLLCLPDFQYQ